LKYKKTAKIFSLNQIDEYVINEKIIEYEENEKVLIAEKEIIKE